MMTKFLRRKRSLLSLCFIAGVNHLGSLNEQIFIDGTNLQMALLMTDFN